MDSILEQHIASLADIVGRCLPEDRAHYNPYSFVQTYGMMFTPQQLPSGIERGPMKQCFENAARLALSSDLIYVEGFAFMHIPIHHAWCVDASGNVIDPTWDDPETSAYFGVPFSDEFILCAMEKTRLYGVIDVPSFREIYDLDRAAFLHERWLGHTDNKGRQ